MNEHSKRAGAGADGTGVAGSIGARDALTEVLRRGAVNLLATAIGAEAAAWIDEHTHVVDANDRRQVVRNGFLPEREVVTGIGPVKVRQPRVHDRRPEEEREKFTSVILPPYLRKTRSMEDLIPWLYLKGVSTGDFSEALAALIGGDTPGFSASTITRLKESWEEDYKAWSGRDLSGKNYVYLWADGIHFNIRLEEDRQCILVLMGATADGTKELIAIADGFRESEQCWKEVLLDVKCRGMVIDPKLAIGDGALGFWKALPQVFPGTRVQRCWVHKSANLLSKLPKRLHGQAKDLLHQVWMAPTKAQAERSFGLFLATYEPKYAAAAQCLSKDRDALLAFYDFPQEHWVHLRTTNPIESTFATVRLRTDKTKGSGSRVACLTMVFKLAESASRKWRALRGSELIREVIAGVVFVDGLKPEKVAA
ncbi:MAG TPA: IS256 family transposase [Candidatus Dormibacteraeota bacterium]|nr:IS256 family transposase [Candidatus Dormibacteraeota bacterium]